MFAKVVLASSAEGRDPVHTLHLHMPRSLQAELSGHRALSQWSRSSRHVPVESMIRELYTAPFVPWHWDRSHPGMTPEERLTPADQLECILLWNDARDRAVEIAQQLDLMNAHRQVVEMVVAPYLWVDTLVTATRWTGFFPLLDHEEADPHLRDLGRMMAKAIGEAEVQRLDIGQWHLPFISADEAAMLEPDDLCKISAARCARVSYAPFEGDAGCEAEFARFGDLTATRTCRPVFEHVLMADSNPEGDHRNTPGWLQFGTMIEGEGRAGR